MPITNSIIVSDSPQADGRRYVTERHTDHLGGTHDVLYLAPEDFDPETAMTSRASQIAANLKQTEINANVAKALNAELVFTFIHSTVAENRVAIRELFRTATKWELMTLGWVIHELNLSDAQLRNLFEITNGEVAVLKARLADIAQRYEDALELAGQ